MKFRGQKALIMRIASKPDGYCPTVMTRSLRNAMNDLISLGFLEVRYVPWPGAFSTTAWFSTDLYRAAVASVEGAR